MSGNNPSNLFPLFTERTWHNIFIRCLPGIMFGLATKWRVEFTKVRKWLKPKALAIQTVKVLFSWHAWYFLYCVASLGNRQHMTRPPQAGNQWSRNDFGTWFPFHKDTFYLHLQIYLHNLQSEVFSAGGRVVGPISEVRPLGHEQEGGAGWRLFSGPDGLLSKFSPQRWIGHIVVPHILFGLPADKKKSWTLLFPRQMCVINPADLGELYSNWHVKWLLQVGIKTKKPQRTQEQPATN